MKHINLSNPLNVVSHCEIRLNQQGVNTIIQQGKEAGLANTEFLNESLNSSNYIPVLNAIWSERDRTRRLEWLRLHQPDMHAPLMLEQAIAEFVHNPTIETIIQISFPLIFSAVFRVRQDSKCSSDPSVYNGDAARRMQATYQMSLNTQTEKLLNKRLPDIIFENKSALISVINAKISEIANLSLSRDLPSPDWIGYHGACVYIGREIQMHSPEDYKKIRDQFAELTISEISTKDNYSG